LVESSGSPAVVLAGLVFGGCGGPSAVGGLAAGGVQKRWVLPRVGLWNRLSTVVTTARPQAWQVNRHCCVSRSHDLVAGNSSAEPRSRCSRSRRSEVRPPVSRVQPQPPRDETVRVPASRSSDRITQQCPSTVPQADRLPGAGSRLLLTGNSANPHSDPGVTQHEPGLVVSELAGEVEGRSAVVVLLRCATGPDV
jgi:hypothetical protein